MKLLKSILIVTVVASFFSCDKEKMALNKLDGEYSFYHYEVDFFDATGTKLDSAWKKDLDGKIVLEHSKDDLPDVHNCTYSLTDIPKGWFNNNVKTQTPKWHSDQAGGKTINFYKFIIQNGIVVGVYQAPYTVTKKGRKLTFSYVQIRPNGTVIFQERLYLKKK